MPKSVIKHSLVLMGLLLFTSFNTELKATHITGGYLSYEPLKDGVGRESAYLVKLYFWRDCYNGFGFDPTAEIRVFRNDTLMQRHEIPISKAIITDIPIELYNPCFSKPENVCVEEALYIDTIYLPASQSPYDLMYQRCCRNDGLLNVYDAGNTGFTWYAQIPGNTNIIGKNSNPVFRNLPPVAVCANADLVLDLGASDKDGDSLRYVFCTPFAGGSANDPFGSQDPPPYNEIIWESGYDKLKQIPSNPLFTLDPNTGLLVGRPDEIGRYQLSICVEEYRNGLLIGKSIRDFQLNVVFCIPITSASIPRQKDFCEGLTIQFGNDSQNASDFKWDFGDPSTDLDFSYEYEPSYTYPDTGYYNVTLIADAGYQCADTSYLNLRVDPAVLPEILFDEACRPDGQYLFNFEAGGTYGDKATFDWDFGKLSLPDSSNAQAPQDINLGDYGVTVVYLNILEHGCVKPAPPMTIWTYKKPQAILDPQDVYCKGLTYNFSQQSVFDPSPTYEGSHFWDFGISGTGNDTSVEPFPEYSFPDTGQYTVSYVASYPKTCPDTATFVFDIQALLEPVILSQDAQCLIGNSFQFEASGINHPQAKYNWVFGDKANIYTSSDPIPPPISYSQKGFFAVELNVEAAGCRSETSNFVRIFPDPVFNTEISLDEGCSPVYVEFTDASTSPTPIYHLWDFGDGFTSNLASPDHQYTEAGSYTITHTQYTTTGCVKSESVEFTDAVRVYPIPRAGFDVDKTRLEPGEPVQIRDQSSAASWVKYDMGDGMEITDRDFEYMYESTGQKYILQVAGNEFNCTDTAMQGVFVQGFQLWVPNAFTPNGDGINDVFKPEGAFLGAYHLKIFNRWGVLVFESFDVNEGWNGLVQGTNTPAQEDIYLFHVIGYEEVYLLPTEFTGHITLAR